MKVTVGMKVRLQPHAMRSRNLRDEEFTVSGPIVGSGPNTFMKLSSELPNWFRWNELSIPAQRHVTARASASGDAAESLLARADQLVADAGGELHLSDALKRAAVEDRNAAARHLESFDTPVNGGATPQIPISLCRHDNESFEELVARVAAEKRLDHRDAIQLVSREYPAEAADYRARR